MYVLCTVPSYYYVNAKYVPVHSAAGGQVPAFCSVAGWHKTYTIGWLTSLGTQEGQYYPAA
jgi:hypothetical protein